MTREDLKQQVLEAIDRRAQDIMGLGDRIRSHPELGFKEVKTARLVEETLGAIGLSPKTGLAMRREIAEVTTSNTRLTIRFHVVRGTALMLMKGIP